MELLVRRRLRALKDPETELLSLIARNGIFLDVGANVGSWSVPAAQVFRAVHAFEPDAKYAMGLRRVVPPNVTVHAVALSNHEGVGSFRVPINDGEELITQASLEPNANVGFDKTLTREVEISTIDSFDFRDVDLIKIDVEGHEAATLEGAKGLIQRERPVLIIEIEERHHPKLSEQIIASITSQDFLCCFLRLGHLEHFERGSVQRLQPKGGHGGTGYKTADYINNFIFIPKERSNLVETINQFLSKR